MFIKLLSIKRPIYNFLSDYDNSKPNINFFVKTIYTVESSEYIIAQKQSRLGKYFQK